MIRILFFLIVVFALGLGFAWLADRPGDMVVTISGYQYQVSLMVAAVAVTAVVAAVMILWWLVKAIWNSPYTISRYFRVRRRDRGYQALSTGMIAAGAGDGVLARKMNKQAAKLINAQTEPLIQLLDAQASLLEGDHETARGKFEAMLDDPEMRLLGLRGLYLEAERLGDRMAARHYAGRAAEAAPHLAWAANATIEERTAQGDWDGALKLVESQKATRQIERDAANRRRAVLLTAKAQSLFDTDPAASRNAALEANKLLPGFAPAAVAAAKVLFKLNDLRKGAKILEAAWRLDAASGCRRALCSCAAGRRRQRPVDAGQKTAVDEAEQCRIRRCWWRVPRSRRATTSWRASGRIGGRAWSRARAPSCCSPTSRRPTAATRAVSANICRRPCVRRATRPGWPTASYRSNGRRLRRSPAGSTLSSGGRRWNGLAADRSGRRTCTQARREGA